jgi:anti-anti-sigma regulatory factor
MHCEKGSVIHVSHLSHEGAVTGRHSGRLLREAVVHALDTNDNVVVDFAGVDMITQSAADEFIGRIVRQHSAFVARISFTNCSREVADMLQWAAEQANSVFQSDAEGMIPV